VGANVTARTCTHIHNTCLQSGRYVCDSERMSVATLQIYRCIQITKQYHKYTKQIPTRKQQFYKDS